MQVLLPFQKEAVESIVSFYHSSNKNGRISLPSGLGKSKIMVHAISSILASNPNCKILYICGTKEQMQQLQEDFVSFHASVNIAHYLLDIKNNGIFIDYYQSILTIACGFDYNFFDLIICDDLNFLNDKYIYPFYNRGRYHNKRLSISNVKNNLIKSDFLVFEYSLADAVKDGYMQTEKEKSFLNFIHTLLKELDFEDIKIENKSRDFGIDICAVKESKQYIFEVKSYRSQYILPELVESACHMFSAFSKKQKDVIPVMILSSLIDADFKKEILSKMHIEILDIANLIFLCKQSTFLLETLSLAISYPIHAIKPEKPIQFFSSKLKVPPNRNVSQYQKFEEQLMTCPPGKDNKADKKFEKICVSIIKYLFASAFFQMSTQHKTNDKLFRMDMICSLKGTTAFWNFLIQFYRTKFVVFEFKNYTKKISQDLIFSASKYLFPEAFRNVCFLISRQGVDKNAMLVIHSKIKGEKKLIVSLTDKDLLIMVAQKEQGKDPSDYLLEKVEETLMSLSIY